jgi:hypothetical protein
MKKIALLLTISTGLLFLASCKKEGTLATYKPNSFQPSALTASGSTLVLDSTNAASTNAVTFNWPSVNFGSAVTPTYSLQFDVPADSFKSPTTVILGSGVSLIYTVKDFNKLAFASLGLPANVTGTMVVRVKADVNQSNGASSTVPSVYSNTINLTVTPYQIIVIYPDLWVPGDYQGWNPPTAPTVASIHSNGVYEGYVNIPAGGTLQFKFTDVPTWNDLAYGAGAGPGTMNTAGSAGNLSVSAGGYYRLAANTSALTWSATATTWAIIGDAPIASNSWANDVPMTYNVNAGTWTVTTACNAGNFKFRANGDWSNNLNNFGDNAPADGIPDYNGGNISVPVAGTYTFTLDLSHSGNYIYSLKKN